MVDAHDHAHSHQNCQGLQRESRCDVKIVLHIAKVEEYGDKDLHHDRRRKQLKETHHRAKQLLTQVVPDRALSRAFLALVTRSYVEVESEDEHEKSDELEGDKHDKYDQEENLSFVDLR